MQKSMLVKTPQIAKVPTARLESCGPKLGCTFEAQNIAWYESRSAPAIRRSALDQIARRCRSRPATGPDVGRASMC